jgi:hypothetical protein
MHGSEGGEGPSPSRPLSAQSGRVVPRFAGDAEIIFSLT